MTKYKVKLKRTLEHNHFLECIMTNTAKEENKVQLTATFPQSLKAVKINIKAIPKIMMLKSFLDSGTFWLNSAGGQQYPRAVSQLSSGEPTAILGGKLRWPRGGRSRSRAAKLSTSRSWSRIRGLG